MLPLIYSSFIIFTAGMVQGAVGFGFALIAVPFLSFVVPLQTLVPALVIFSLFINSMVVISTKKHIALKEIWLLIVMGIIGIPFGVYGLKSLNPETLKLIVGIIIIITSIAMLKGFKLKIHNKIYSYSITGFISGVLNGSISMSGPPIVLFLANEGYEKDKFRSNINAYAVITNIITILTLGFSGLLNNDVYKFTSIHLISLILGTDIGIVLSKRFNEAVFKKIILFLLVITGFIAIIKAI